MSAQAFPERFPDLIDGLKAAYAEPGRAYHAWTHIEALIAAYERLRDRFADAEAVELAIYYHDVVYVPGATDNEAMSAERMLAELAGRADRPTLDYAAAIIRTTATHRVPDGSEPGLASDCALFLDMDLAILGAAPELFDAYDAAIRREFTAIPESLYSAGRLRIMQGFLDRPRIYLTQTFHRSHDAPARANLRRLIERLG